MYLFYQPYTHSCFLVAFLSIRFWRALCFDDIIWWEIMSYFCHQIPNCPFLYNTNIRCICQTLYIHPKISQYQVFFIRCLKTHQPFYMVTETYRTKYFHQEKRDLFLQIGHFAEIIMFQLKETFLLLGIQSWKSQPLV